MGVSGQSAEGSRGMRVYSTCFPTAEPLLESAAWVVFMGFYVKKPVCSDLRTNPSRGGRLWICQRNEVKAALVVMVKQF